MFNYSKNEEIKICDMCFGEGKSMEDSGNGGMVRTGSNCPRCNGTGRIILIEIKKVVAFDRKEKNGE